MNLRQICSLLLLCVPLFDTALAMRYEPNWDSLDSRPLPSWYDEAKFGIFITWGVYAVPSYSSEWVWRWWHDGDSPSINAFFKKNYPPNITYADFAKDFTTEFYNPDEWADIFEASGARYTVFVTKHCDGYTMWPSKTSFNWNSNATGPNRDLVGEFAAALRRRASNVKVGLYHCLHEWFNPLYLRDKARNFTTQDYVNYKVIPALYELINNYKPEVLWSDMCEFKGPASYFKSQDFLAWLYNDSPVKDTIVTNDRWCDTCFCKHGGYMTCQDEFNPGVLQKRKWEGGWKIYEHSWSYVRDTQLSQFRTVEDIISHFVMIISCGGNMLLDIGPTKEGKIIPIFEERLRQIGSWMKVNGEGIYSSVPWSHQNDTMIKNVWYTMKRSPTEGKVVYAFLLSWPEDSVLKLGAPISSQKTQVTMLGYPESFSWIAGPGGQGMYITIPAISWNKLPCKWAWVLKLTLIEN